ncbi:receptor-type tyrosine-protein phosphatase H [Seriola aureovittata]|uniref:receptor-type tyrosine-protein phosphatase H n=1 Tax=Seriola aureovittata TaxID=2871759 RepID=UPI0024BEF254|nr:receptor-type tyrosine-protein phosphatase H [Seriola aureovittata]
MKPLLRFSVSLWTLLVFIALLKNSHAQCSAMKCGNNETLTVTTTTVKHEHTPNCTLSTGGNISRDSFLTGLTPGAVYEIFINCSSCCANVTLTPDVVRNLTVTNVTTSSVSVDWSEPEGNSSFYRVQWTDGQFNDTSYVSETSMTISNLTAGVQYKIIVTAVADDNHTDGQSTAVTQYTRPGIIGNHHIVSQNTSSISVNWASPPGEVFMYRLEWHNGGVLMTRYTNDTFAVLSELISGTNYTITVTAVAGDNETEGDPYTFTSFTSKHILSILNYSFCCL